MLKTIQKILNNQLYTVSLYARQISGTVVLFFIARYLSVFEYGIFTSYKSIATFCFMFANMDFANYILVSSAANVKEIKLKISLFLLNAINVGILIILFSMFFKLDNHFLFSLVVIRTFFDMTFFALILPYFQASKQFNLIGKINIVYSVCIMLIAVVSFIFKLSLAKFLILNIILGFINFIQCTYFAKINYFLVFGHIKRFLNKLDKSIFGYMFSTLTDYLYGQTSALYVAIFMPKEDAALFFSAVTIASVVALLITAQTQKMTPELINSDYSKAVKIMKTNISYLMIILAIILVFLIFGGKLLLVLLYGQEYYKNAYGILLIYFIAQIFMANGGLWGSYLTAINKQAKKATMKLETTVITIIGLFALHKFGIYGAAFALLISAIYVSARYTLCSLHYLKKQKENNHG